MCKTESTAFENSPFLNLFIRYLFTIFSLNPSSLHSFCTYTLSLSIADFNSSRLCPSVKKLRHFCNPSLHPNMPDGPGIEIQKDEERLIIAVDFGTTYSGIAYCFAGQRDKKVGIVTEWPKSESASKIPTIIKYNSPKSRNLKDFEWGPSVNRHMDTDAIVAVKLMLDPSQERPLYLPSRNIKKDIKKLPKPAAEVSADFIGAMYKHALVQIGKEVKTAYLNMCKKEFVLSGTWTTYMSPSS